jgi:hypothetical protein
MRLTYSDILAAHLRNIGKVGSTDATILADFQYSLGQRYQMVFGTIGSYVNQQTLTTTTIASQQFYYYPPGIVSVDDAMVTIGTRQFPVNPVYDQHTWNEINAIPFQGALWPQFVFNRRDDFGLWPTPQDAYTLTLNAFMRDRNLLVADYSSGTISLTAGSATVTGASTTFTPAMVGRWLTVTDTATPGQGFWYRIRSYSSATSINLDTFWAGSNASSVTYRIGETPELPEEAHVLLAAGTAADYYAGMQADITQATWFNNVFWTGDGNNNARNMGNKDVAAGLIGLMNKYQGRERKTLIQRGPVMRSPAYSIWGQTITTS